MDHQAKYQSATKDDPKYLVWSNEHRAWWGPSRCGYATGITGAGQYSRAAAIAICRDALLSSAQVGVIAEVPVRLDDIAEILHQQTVPETVLGAKPEPWPFCG